LSWIARTLEVVVWNSALGTDISEHAWDRQETNTIFWFGKLKGRDHFEGLEVGGDNIIMGLVEVGWEVWTGFIWLRIGTPGGLL